MFTNVATALIMRAELNFTSFALLRLECLKYVVNASNCEGYLWVGALRVAR